MTERGGKALRPSAEGLEIGPSSLHWRDGRLRIDIDEIAPLRLAPLRGTVTLTPEILPDYATDFGTGGRHRWSPIAPRAHVEVRLKDPSLSWDGTGYFDMNRGDEPIEDGFAYWNWSRACLHNKAVVLYDVIRRDGESASMGLEIASGGAVTPVDMPQHCMLAKAPIWKMPRETRCDRGQSASIARTFEDTPFYSRSMLSTRLLGEPAAAMHESLSLDRFRKRWVQTLLRFRMPRLAL
jgi:carotenoid 1,2-hydratase